MERTKNYKFNILDVIIILVVIACIIGLLVRSGLADQFAGKSEKAIITFDVYGMMDKTVDETLVVGDLYYSDWVRGEFGELTAILEKRNSLYVFQDENGVQCETTVPYRDDVTGTFICEGYYEDGAFFIDGEAKVTPGETYEVYSARRRMTIHVISVKPAD